MEAIFCNWVKSRLIIKRKEGLGEGFFATFSCSKMVNPRARYDWPPGSGAKRKEELLRQVPPPGYRIRRSTEEGPVGVWKDIHGVGRCP